MSSEGRRRVVMGAMRATMGMVAVVLVAWGSWQVVGSLRDTPAGAADPGKGDRVKSLVLATDGVLDRNWLARTLAVPPNATLMGLDLPQLRAKVLGDPQVISAEIVRNFPDTLTVRIAERSPVVRMMAQGTAEAPRMLLVSRDGVAFSGTGFDPAMVASLPWIEGVKLVQTGKAFAPVEGMKAVSELLATARLEADGLYRSWQVVSLAKLAADGEIEVWDKAGMKVVFGTTEDYLRQVARLDLLVDRSTDPTHPLKEVNLALGAQVPVAYGTASPFIGTPPVNTLDAESVKPVIAFPSSSSLHIDTKREL
jgi:cell division septal protein FtsQ